MTACSRIVLSGYLVRYPLGGYAWQAAQYLLGLPSLGHDVWFYEDTDTILMPMIHELMN